MAKKVHPLKAPLVEASNLQSPEARNLVRRRNGELAESFRALISAKDVDVNDVLLGMTALERHATLATVEVLQHELEHTHRLLQQAYDKSGARRVHVRRDDGGQIVELVALNGNAA